MRFLSNLLFVFLFLPCFAINNVLENILLNEDETYHATDLYQQLDEYEKNPININTANIEQLTYFIWLSENDLQKILQFRKAAQITSINDLKKLGISVNSVRNYLREIGVSKNRVGNIINYSLK